MGASCEKKPETIRAFFRNRLSQQATPAAGAAALLNILRVRRYPRMRMRGRHGPDG